MSDRGRVLVCDDEPQILRALKVILREAGFEAVARRDGARRRSTAPRCARPTPRSSTSCCPTATASRSAAQLREWSQMPIIVLSRRRRRGRRRSRALEAGADDYVDEAVRRRASWSRACRRRCGARRRRAGRAGDRARRARDRPRRARVVRRDGEEVHLTPIEFDLLRDAGAQPRPADDPPRAADRGLGPGSTPTTRRSCAPTSPTCAARSSRAGEPRYIRTDPGVGLPLRRLSASCTTILYDGWRRILAWRLDAGGPTVSAMDIVAIALAVAVFALLCAAHRRARPRMSALEPLRPGRLRAGLRLPAVRAAARREVLSQRWPRASSRSRSSARCIVAVVPLLGGYMARVFRGERDVPRRRSPLRSSADLPRCCASTPSAGRTGRPTPAA